MIKKNMMIRYKYSKMNSGLTIFIIVAVVIAVIMLLYNAGQMKLAGGKKRNIQYLK